MWAYSQKYPTIRMEHFSESNNTSEEPSLGELNINIGLTDFFWRVTVLNFQHSECDVLVNQIMLLKNFHFWNCQDIRQPQESHRLKALHIHWRHTFYILHFTHFISLKIITIISLTIISYYWECNKFHTLYGQIRTITELIDSATVAGIRLVVHIKCQL